MHYLQQVLKGEAAVQKPFRRYDILVPLAVFVAGLTLILVYYVGNIVSAKADELVFDAPGRYEIRLPETGKYRLLYEPERNGVLSFLPPSAVDDMASGISLEMVRSVSQREVGLVRQTGSEYTTGFYRGEPLYAFHGEGNGVYMLNLRYDPSRLDIPVTLRLLPDVRAEMMRMYRYFAFTLLATLLAAVITRYTRRKTRKIR